VSESFDLVIAGGICVTRRSIESADVGIRGGRIAQIGALVNAQTAERFDARGLHVLPGIIDTHAHFREPGLEHKEDMETGSRAAVLGGVTSVFEMPNTVPPTTSRESVADKLARAKTSMHCHYAFYVGATPATAEILGELEELPGVAGVKAFLGSSTGSLLLDQENDIRVALRSGRRRMSVHSEDEARLKERQVFALPGDPSTHPVWRDAETARRSTERILRLAREAGRRLHVLHVTTADEIPLLTAARDIATFEVTPQHLTLTAPECYRRLGTRAQMNPPIRDAEHQAALWRAVTEGLADVIGSDHAPHTLEEKSGLYPHTPSGMPGIQTMVTVMLDHVHAGRLSLQRAVDLMSHGPARVFGITNKGDIALGFDADLTIVDLRATRRIENRWIASRCGWTPYDGVVTTGWPVATLVDGSFAMRDGAVAAGFYGRPIRFAETPGATAA
jgi:dihydroorotase